MKPGCSLAASGFVSPAPRFVEHRVAEFKANELATTTTAATDTVVPASADYGGKSVHVGTHYHLHNVPTMRLFAATCVGLVKDGKTTAAKEVEKIGKICYGDAVFEQAVKEAGIRCALCR